MAEKKVTVTPAATKEVTKKEAAPITTAKTTSTEKPVAKTVEKVVEKVAEKKPAEKKAAPKKVAAKKPAVKKAAAKKEVVADVFVQFGDSEVLAKDVLENAKNAWAAMTGKKVSDISDIKVYIKPEEFMAYYVINGDTGSINL